VYETRQASYAEVATIAVDVDARSPAEIADDVLARLDEGRLGGLSEA
jgi:hypothetical protein